MAKNAAGRTALAVGFALRLVSAGLAYLANAAPPKTGTVSLAWKALTGADYEQFVQDMATEYINLPPYKRQRPITR